MKNILVINTMCIGDIVLTTPALHVLKKNLPEAQITMLTDKRYMAVLANNPNIDEILPMDKKGEHKGLRGFYRLVKTIKARKFDIVVNLSCNERSILLTILSGAKKKVGYQHKCQEYFLDGSVPFSDIPSGKRHFADANVDILRPLNLQDYSHNGPEIFPDETDIRFAEEFCRNEGITDKDIVVGFNVGASWPTKRWTEDGFREVAKRLQKNTKVIFFGSPDEISAVEGIVEGLEVKPIIATGKTTLRQLSALLKHCKVLLTNDTGPMHIAVASGIPVVAIYGPSPVGSFAPYGKGNIIICHHLPCAPCGQHHCDSHDCMKDITSEEIEKAIMDILSLEKE